MRDLVQIEAGKVVATSRRVAEVFGKQHKDVLRSVRNLDCSSDFNQRNFAPVKYEDQKGELRTEFHITRDGFTFLVMGFTGQKAAAFKEAYIKAFNEMEDALKQSVTPAQALLSQAQMLVSIEQRQRETDARLLQVEAKVQTVPNYFTIAGYCRLNGLKRGLYESAAIGRKASKLCKDKGYSVESVKDMRYGMVNSYPEEILNQVFVGSV